MKKILIAAAILVAFTAQDAVSQTADASLSGTVEQSLFISLDEVSVTFPNANAAAFEAGYTQIAGGTLTYKGNVAHSVTVAADAATLSATELAGNTSVARTDKPAGDVSWSTDGTTFNAFSTTAASVVSGAAAGEATKALTYQMALDWASDSPGVYALDVTYTIAAD